jgi:hypothetical protein
MTQIRFGKHPPKLDYRNLRFGNYASGLKAPPAEDDVLKRVYDKLKINDPKALFPMDGNDTKGDCTCAGLAHAITVFRGLLGDKRIMPTASVLKLYFKLTGGPDTGLNELDVLNYWRKNAVDGDKILAFAQLNVKKHDQIKQAIHEFGGCYLGFQVQENAIPDFDARKPWTPGKLTNDGHAVYAVAYDDKTVTVLTWGNTQVATWGWWDECVDEAYAILPPEAKKNGWAQGFDYDQLQHDLAAL